ncbi:MAG: biotin transporter BioY [Microcoleaceae cyanobacterium]
MGLPLELLWAIVGLLLTISGTFLEAFVASPTWLWEQQDIHLHSLGVTFQIGAVLFVGCMGGKNAAAISQIAYLILGLTILPIFSEGGGLRYFQEPTFGYLLGFIPGGWICGLLAFRSPPKLEFLSLSCCTGLLAIHACGIAYLFSGYAVTEIFGQTTSFAEAFYYYSLRPLPGQIGVVCAVTVLSYGMRRILFY